MKYLIKSVIKSVSHNNHNYKKLSNIYDEDLFFQVEEMALPQTLG